MNKLILLFLVGLSGQIFSPVMTPVELKASQSRLERLKALSADLKSTTSDHMVKSAVEGEELAQNYRKAYRDAVTKYLNALGNSYDGNNKIKALKDAIEANKEDYSFDKVRELLANIDKTENVVNAFNGVQEGLLQKAEEAKGAEEEGKEGEKKQEGKGERRRVGGRKRSSRNTGRKCRSRE